MVVPPVIHIRSRSNQSGLWICATAVLFLIGCNFVVSGFLNGAQEARRGVESSAIRSILYEIDLALGFILIGLSLITANIIRLIQK